MQALYPTKWNAAMGEMADASGNLSVQAKVWRRALEGVTGEQIRTAVDYLTDNYSSFIPDLGEFKKLCLKGTDKDVPSVEKIMNMVINASYAQGSIADRYKHPLAWAVAQHKDLDKHNLKTATTRQALAMITPVYQDILQSGWQGFTESDYEVRLSIEQKRSRTSELNAKEYLSGLKGALRVETKKPDSFHATEDYKVPDEVLREMEAEAEAMKARFKTTPARITV